MEEERKGRWEGFGLDMEAQKADREMHLKKERSEIVPEKFNPAPSVCSHRSFAREEHSRAGDWPDFNLRARFRLLKKGQVQLKH